MYGILGSIETPRAKTMFARLNSVLYVNQIPSLRATYDILYI